MKKLTFLLFLLFVPLIRADRIDEPAAVTVTTTSTALYPASPDAISFIFTNSGTTPCFLSCTATAVNGRGIYLPAGGAHVFDVNDPRKGPFSAITATGTTTIAISVRLSNTAYIPPTPTPTPTPTP